MKAPISFALFPCVFVLFTLSFGTRHAVSAVDNDAILDAERENESYHPHGRIANDPTPLNINSSTATPSPSTAPIPYATTHYNFTASPIPSNDPKSAPYLIMGLIVLAVLSSFILFILYVYKRQRSTESKHKFVHNVADNDSELIEEMGCISNTLSSSNDPNGNHDIPLPLYHPVDAKHDDILGNEFCIDSENNSVLSSDSLTHFCDTATYDPLSTSCGSSQKYKVFLSYVQNEATRAVLLFKTELKKKGHKCWLDLDAKDKSVSGMEEGIRKCNIFFPFLTESYLSRRACLMELAWAMKYRKRVQPLHLPKETDKITCWTSMAPQTFQWVFSINSLPVQDSDSRLLRCSIPVLLADANQVKICPPLPDGMNEQEVVNQTMLEFETRKGKINDRIVDCDRSISDEDNSLLSFDPSTDFSEALSHFSEELSCDGDSPYYKLFLSYEKKDAKPAVKLFKAELEKLGHSCCLSIHARNKGDNGTESAIKKCDIFFLILTEGYLTLDTCLMEVAWAMEYGKKVQPLHLPPEKDKIGYWSSITPQTFRWVFAINILPLENTDSRLLRRSIPLILSDACKRKTSPSLARGMSVEEAVKQAMLEVEVKTNENR